MKNIKKIAEEYEQTYRENNLPDSLDDIILMAEEEKREATERYKKLPEPRAASLVGYVLYSVRKKIENDLASKTTEKVSVDSKNLASVALAEIFESYPKCLLENTAKELFNKTSFEEKNKYWEEKKQDFVGFPEKYMELVESRNIMAKRKGYKDYLDQYLRSNKVDRKDYQFFIDNQDKYIALCNKKISDILVNKNEFYSEYSVPCYVCIGEFLSIKSSDELIDLVAKEYPILSKFKNKIQIFLGEGAATVCQTETDSFSITIRKEVNSRHRLLDLLHELCHVVCMIETMGNDGDFLGEGRYQQEKIAMEMVLRFLKQYSDKVYDSYIGNWLVDLWVALFELEVNKNGRKDLAKLNADMFNRCFDEGNQVENPVYVLNSKLLFSPFNSLMYMVAAANLLVK